MALIEASMLSVGPAGRILARGIAFALEPGQILVVLGPNGAGKTTLFRTLLGLTRPLAGEVRLSGAPLSALSRPEIARRVAYVAQSMTMPFPYTARDYVLAGRTASLGPFSAPGKADRRKAQDALGTLGIAWLADAPVTRLSGGERQLVMIARALAQDAPALLLDEPASALDFGNRERLAILMERLSATGLGLMFTSHDPNFAERLAHRILTIDREGNSEHGAPGDMLNDARISRLYDLDPAATSRARLGRRATVH
ncbi:ABC transporter ATP-binding protein [Tropicimonas sp.]|uniref:ABC transporter ATP-binding protein n=1 Tax=Tropicimonas sp. TaxID=2067044 RepID=UPI003A84C23D